MRRFGITLLVLALLGGTTAAFAITERLKLERAPITAPRFDKRFSPTCACATRSARLTIRLRKEDVVDAAIVDRAGEIVRTLASDEGVGKGEKTFVWDGRNDAGAVASDGRYRLRLHLERSRRVFLIPTPVLVDTRPPRVRIVDIPRLTISPDGDGRNDRLEIVYRAGEKSSAEVLVNGEIAVRGKTRLAGRTRLGWGGRIGGAALPAGVYGISVRVRDRAGNVSKPTEAVSVRIRYVNLTKLVYRVRRGGLLRFRVATDGIPFRWYLFRPRGEQLGRPVLYDLAAERNAVAVRLSVDLKPGRYVLRVAASGHRDRGLLFITRAGR